MLMKLISSKHHVFFYKSETPYQLNRGHTAKQIFFPNYERINERYTRESLSLLYFFFAKLAVVHQAYLFVRYRYAL